MTDYYWINYNEENIHELYNQEPYEQNKKITQKELINEKQKERTNQVQTKAREIYNNIITMNPYFNEDTVYAHSTMTLLPDKRTNGYMLYQKVLHNWFWKANPLINIQRERIATNALLWKNLSKEQKLYFGQNATLLNNQYKLL